MTWAYFQNQAAWDAYHNAKCADLAIPRAGYSGPGETTTQVLNQWTDAWVEPIQVKGTGNVTAWVAHVDPADVVKYSLGLNIPDNQVTTDPVTGLVSFTYQGRTYTGNPADPVGFPWQKSKPATWTDKHGVTYDTTTGQPV